MKTALVLGAGGFIGSHLVKRLKEEGYWVRGVDLKKPEYWKTYADDFLVGDLRNEEIVKNILEPPHPYQNFDEVYQLAADMGGAGYIFTGENDADVMHNSAIINIHVLFHLKERKFKGKIFYSSSACMYPQEIQQDPNNPGLKEEFAYPANPDSEYGWEKLFSERLYLAFNRNYKIDVRIARFHNIFGPYGTWQGGKEKAPAAILRKVIEVPDLATEEVQEIEIWGDGQQTRSFLYIDECVEGVRRFMQQDSFLGPINIGSEEMISINDFARMIINISDKFVTIKNIPGPLGVRGRKSDNTLIGEKLGWKPSQPLVVGIEKTYKWIKEQYENSL